MNRLNSPIFLLIVSTLVFASHVNCQQKPSGGVEPAVRVARFRIDYPKADLTQINKLPNWPIVMRKSVLASLRFVNKHWLICGEADNLDKKTSAGNVQKKQIEARERTMNDCGKLQVTGETVKENYYRINATFIANRDPVKNTKVDATSTVYGVVQIGLRGGIFQYTNAMKVLGKPTSQLDFEEAFFCYPGYELVQQDKCQKLKNLRQHRSLLDS